MKSCSRKNYFKKKCKMIRISTILNDSQEGCLCLGGLYNATECSLNIAFTASWFYYFCFI